MSFDISRARDIAEPQLGAGDDRAVWNILARLLLEACDEIERLTALVGDTVVQEDWPTPAPLAEDYWESAE